ncbi:MAG: diguanylate cyclase with sensor [Aeromicrobium sp.]|nr:diguanylate cyclase with sensor [Aeromicrobium sp.]
MADPDMASPQSDNASDDRDASAEARDRTSTSHDNTADERDGLAALRDTRADARDSASGHVDVDAATDRDAARRDRNSAKADRDHASHDRQAAFTDRSLSSQERAVLLLDELTGSYRRAAGFLELEREIVIAERTEQRFTLAFIDVDGLKSVNDTLGHDAGDDLLRTVVRSVRDVVRDYDVIVRYGGDEFICGMADVATSEVIARFDKANLALRAADHSSVSVGVVERKRGEGLASLIDRADTAMYEGRERR